MASISNSAAKELLSVLDGRIEQVSPTPTQTQTATVTSATAGNLWVVIGDSNVPTPVTSSVCEVQLGDTVTVQVNGGSCSITGNTSNVAASTATANVINNKAVQALDDAAQARSSALEAMSSASIAKDAADSAQASAQQAITDAKTANDAAQSAVTDAKTALEQSKVAEQAAIDAATAQKSAEEAAYKADTAASNAEIAAGNAQSAQDAVNTAIDNIQNSIVESLDQFYLSDSPTELSGGSWSTTATWTAGKYIWTRTRTIRYLDKDKANPYTYMPNETGTCITGNTGAKGEDAAVVRIDSSRGTVFKNAQVSTVLTVHVHYGSQIIEDKSALQAAFGAGAYIEWQWLKSDSDQWGIIPNTDTRLSNDGFALTLTPEDVDVKVTFKATVNS